MFDIEVTGGEKPAANEFKGTIERQIQTIEIWGQLATVNG